MRPKKTLVPMKILFAKFSAARLANQQQYSPKFSFLGPKKPKPQPKPQPKLEPKGPGGKKKR